MLRETHSHSAPFPRMGKTPRPRSSLLEPLLLSPERRGPTTALPACRAQARSQAGLRSWLFGSASGNCTRSAVRGPRGFPLSRARSQLATAASERHPGLQFAPPWGSRYSTRGRATADPTSLCFKHREPSLLGMEISHPPSSPTPPPAR